VLTDRLEPLTYRANVCCHGTSKVRPGGTLLFMGCTGGRRTAAGLAFTAAFTAALPAMAKSLAPEVAPIRVNLIAAGFVDTPLSASLLGDRIGELREQLRTTLPIGRVVGPADIAALAVHLMTKAALSSSAGSPVPAWRIASIQPTESHFTP
jgi:NAD(P)-dependent dehydrogenase (short-subunit alcohol dehydrogenase family)